ncbi:MAG: hypothetical protein U9R15_04725 [Chloroflexota bacterium]|nr:hypothetical protein [Chloroflexota bacterium]
MSSIKECFKPKATKNRSSKTPKFYNNEKNLLILDAACSSDPAVRRFVANNEHTPAKVLQGMLEIEQDKQILRTVIMAKNMSRKAVAAFVNDAEDVRVEWFEDDEEMIEYFQQ